MEAFGLFRHRPLVWLALNALLLFIGSALMLVPLIGALVFALLTPVFMAGLMLGCREVESGGRLELGQLFHGFRHNAAQLVTVGGVYLAGQVVVVGVMLFLGGDELKSVVAGVMQDGADTESATVSTDRLSFAVLVGAALFTPLAMAIWFAPPLVALENLPAFAAMRASMRGCLRNLVPMLVYGGGVVAALLVFLFFLSTVLRLLPPQIGFIRGTVATAAFVVWVTLTLISVYTSYRDIFARGAGGLHETGDGPQGRR